MLTTDPLRFDDGRQTTPPSWLQRRRELARAIVPHEYGGLPPTPAREETILCRANRIAPERVIALNQATRVIKNPVSSNFTSYE